MHDELEKLNQKIRGVGQRLARLGEFGQASKQDHAAVTEELLGVQAKIDGIDRRLSLKLEKVEKEAMPDRRQLNLAFV